MLRDFDCKKDTDYRKHPDWKILYANHEFYINRNIRSGNSKRKCSKIQDLLIHRHHFAERNTLQRSKDRNYCPKHQGRIEFSINREGCFDSYQKIRPTQITTKPTTLVIFVRRCYRHRQAAKENIFPILSLLPRVHKYKAKSTKGIDSCSPKTFIPSKIANVHRKSKKEN